ncbi:MAG: hypothetical protein L6R41_007888 [Letrouitia leprolyta]|nr:MAG: hypothetical protein L6R41_007888 [Letrouitia leprolyta]
MAVRQDSPKADLYGATIPLTILANLVVIGRLFARQASAASLWWDDYMIVVALNIEGLDRHTAAANGPLGPAQLTKFAKLHYAVQILYFFSAVSIKTSLLLLYHRLFGVCSACAASITRVVAFKQVDHEDITYTEVPASVWTVIEQYVGIICACLPALWALLSRCLAFLKNGSKHVSKTDGTARSHAVQLPRYGSKNRPHALTDTSSTGFTLLDEERRDQSGSVTAQASKDESHHSPVLKGGIYKTQKIEQEVEDCSWLRTDV